jgi:hypothetical protein
MAEAIRLVHSWGWNNPIHQSLTKTLDNEEEGGKSLGCRREKNTIDLCPNILYVNCRYLRLSLQKIEEQLP